MRALALALALALGILAPTAGCSIVHHADPGYRPRDTGPMDGGPDPDAWEPDVGMDDCDDASAVRYPGAPDVCDGLDDDCDGVVDCGCTFPFFTEQSVNSNAPFFAYYDSDVSTCDILGAEFQGAWIFYEDNIFPAALAIELEGQKIVATLTEESQCIAYVGENITEEDYESALATLRAVIADNPATPNICDLFGMKKTGHGTTALMGRKAEFAARLKQMLAGHVKHNGR